MDMFATFRNRRAQSIVSGIIILWLNLVLLPCALALDGSDDHDCPNCPPEHTNQHAGHDMPGHVIVDELPCAISPEDCSFADDLIHDGRSIQLELNDAPSDVPLAVHPEFVQSPGLQPNGSARWQCVRGSPPGPRISLNILYCVYLD